MTVGSAASISQRGPAWEVLLVFLRLGLTSFGGPIAHLGYFHDEFVVRRRWLEEKTYADLVALCQFLPGPASSQVGIAIGLSRAGYLGSLAAWVGFTLPSAIALVLFAYGVEAFGGARGGGWLHGLKVVAVAVVAQAVLVDDAVAGARSRARDARRDRRRAGPGDSVRLGANRRDRARRGCRPRAVSRSERRSIMSRSRIPSAERPASLRSRCSSRCCWGSPCWRPRLQAKA